MPKMISAHTVAAVKMRLSVQGLAVGRGVDLHRVAVLWFGYFSARVLIAYIPQLWVGGFPRSSASGCSRGRDLVRADQRRAAGRAGRVGTRAPRGWWRARARARTRPAGPPRARAGAAGRRARMQQVVVRRARRWRRSARRPRSGPSASAIATARLSATTGRCGCEQPRRARRSARQSVDGRATCSAAIARLHAVRPARRGRRASARPSSICARVPARAVLIVEQHEPPVGVDPRVAPRVVEQHQREQAARLRAPGHQLDEQPASRIASAHSSRRTSASPAVAA